MVANVLVADISDEPDCFFHRLEKNLQSNLIIQGKRSQHKKGEMLLPAGIVTGKLYILLVGVAKITRSEHDKHLTIARLNSGDMFGELSMINQLPTSADVVALEESVVLAIDQDEINRLLLSSPDFMRLFMETLANRTREVIENVCSMALEDVYSRLRRLLLNLSVSDGVHRKIEGVTHGELGEMVGASREMVSIIIKELKVGDYLRVDGRTITLLKKLPVKR